MKKIIPKGLMLGCSLALCGLTAVAQNHSDDHDHEGHDHYQVGTPTDVLYTEEPATHLTCVTDADYQAEILPLLEASYQELKNEGKLAPADFAPKNIGAFQWPLRMSDAYAREPGVFDYYTIWNYADLQDGTGRKDWMCATGNSSRNYNSHNGADIVPHPFRWKMQAEGSVDVIAAANGQVLFFQDGNFDRNCGSAGHIQGTYPGYGVYGNFVALLHPDNSVSLYGHMKNGSVANLVNGQSIVAGQYLGKVGSSGNSSDPHLHFEVRPCLSCAYVEPWFTNANTCNTTVNNSWWQTQRPYWDPGILRIMTHSSNPTYSTCVGYEAGTLEDVNERNHFNSGAFVTIGAYLRDVTIGQTVQVRMYSPTNVLLQTWTHTSQFNYGSGFDYQVNRLMTGASNGTYRVQVAFNSEVKNHYFTIGCTSSYTLSGAHSGYKGWIASSTITSTQSTSASSLTSLFLEAGTSITLNTGFQTGIGSTFLANIDACTINSTIIPEDEGPQTEELLESLQVYPNPSNGQFTVRAEYIGESRGATIIVRNSLGQVVEQRNIAPGSNLIVADFDTRNVSGGMYFVEFRSETQQHVQKLIIQ